MKTVTRLKDMTPEVLASFEMVDGEMVAVYNDEGYKRSLEADGIFTVASGAVRPNDGQTFYDALELAYANSSRIDVISDD